MERYASLGSDMVNRIMSMAEKESTNRHLVLNTELAQEGRLITFDGVTAILGMVCALIICLAGIGGSVACILHGYEIGGGILGAGTLGGIVSTFIVGNRMRQEKAKKSTGKKE